MRRGAERRAAALVAALRRLERSTGRLARKRARRAFAAAARAVLGEYPVLGADGAASGRARKLYSCPVGCRMPPLGAAALGIHLRMRHDVLGVGARRLAALARTGRLETVAIQAATAAAMGVHHGR